MQHHRIAQRGHNHTQAFHHAFQALRAPDMERFVPPGLFQAQQQSGQPRTVVAVVMGQQQPVHAPETPAKPADADLGAFAAVNQESAAVHPQVYG